MTSPGAVLDWMGNLRPNRGALHKPLAVLWVLGRVAAGQRWVRWREFGPAVDELLRVYASATSKPTSYYPFWHLSSGGFWELRASYTSAPTRTALDADDPEAGFTDGAYSVLSDPAHRARAVAIVRRTYLAAVAADAIVDAVGLTGCGTAAGVPRKLVTRQEVQRNAANKRRISDLYDDRCQVCGTRLDLLGRGYSEAAHIRGLGAPHDGEDAVENMLCLCPNCHTRFDGFALAIDEELFIHEVTAAGEGPAVGKLTVAADHKIDVRHLDYHRRFLARS